MNRTKILKHVVNILAVVLLSAIAFLFTAYAFTYKNVDFIAVHFDAMVVLAGAVAAVFAVLGVLFYATKKTSLYRLVVCTLVFIDICAIIFFALCASGLIAKINSVDALREYIEGAGAWAAFIYILFSFLQVVLLPVPGSVAVAVGTAMFGPLKGYKAVCWIVGKESLDKWLNKLKGKDYLILSLMFLLPLFPDDILCFVAGMSSMTWGYFLIMITVTRAISIFSSAYSFELIPFTTWWGIMIWAIIIGLVIMSFYLVCKYYEKIDYFIKNKLKIGKSK